jgi:hypothetical protein
LAVRILTEYDLEEVDLKGVRVLVLPNVACLSERAAEVIRRFVRQGGGLVASFETSLYDENFARREDFGHHVAPPLESGGRDRTGLFGQLDGQSATAPTYFSPAPDVTLTPI